MIKHDAYEFHAPAAFVAPFFETEHVDFESAFEKLCPGDAFSFVKDRPVQDFHYAIDPAKIEKELGWKPLADFDTHLRTTVKWYLENQIWCEKALARIKDNAC